MENTTGLLSLDGAVDQMLQPEEATEETIAEENTTEEVEPAEEPQAEEPEQEPQEEAEETDEEVDEQDSEEPVYAVKVDGTEIEVPLSELKRGYSGQRFVQKGMQEAAEARKTAEAAHAALIAERDRLAQMRQMYEQGGFPVQPTPPSKQLFESDPLAYHEKRLDYEVALEKYQQDMSQFDEMQKRQDAALNYAQQEHMKREVQALQAQIPEFQDPEKATKYKEDLITHAKDYGFTPEEVGGIVDHRALLVLNDAVQYRRLQQGKNKALAKASTAKQKTNVVKSGAKKVNSNEKAFQNKRNKLRRTGNIDDAVALMLKT